MNQPSFDFGMIGLGTMGRNLLLNIADHGFSAAGFDKDLSKVQQLGSVASPGTLLQGFTSLPEMMSALRTPRKIMMLVPAGAIVDAVISDLLPLLEQGDILIDGGNSHYTDTQRRIDSLRESGIHFMGMGISGGEQGARTGPSMMPGGDSEAWETLRPVLEAIAAKAEGEPCVAYMGKGAAGHYVKMVHNGIEYAIMQLISEAYDILKRGAGYTTDELHDLFRTWNEGEMKSFLIEITATVFRKEDEMSRNRLLDMILDKAGSKGTGKWTSQDAMDLPVPVPTIDTAVAFRDLSTLKDQRTRAAAIYKPRIKPVGKEGIAKPLHGALFAATIVSYAQGLAMLQTASHELKMDIPVSKVIRIWRGGCIIRSRLLEIFSAAYGKKEPLPNILLNKQVAGMLKKNLADWRKIIKIAASSRIPVAGLMSTLAYFDAYCSEQMPVNLIQAQRDFFGAHGYQRTDREGNFHSEWNG